MASRNRSSTGVEWGSLIVQSPQRKESRNGNENTDHGDTVAVQLTTKKFQTFIRCSVKLLISCGNKHKNFLESNRTLLEDTITQLIADIEEQLAQHEGNK